MGIRGFGGRSPPSAIIRMPVESSRIAQDAVPEFGPGIPLRAHPRCLKAICLRRRKLHAMSDSEISKLMGRSLSPEECDVIRRALASHDPTLEPYASMTREEI